MYAIYHTDAFVLSALPRGEGDRTLSLYTHRMGLIAANVKSVRELRSRLRYALQPYARAEVDLVRGKHGWKLTSARPVDSHRDIWGHPEKRVVLERISGLLLRLVAGEEAHPDLFEDLARGLTLIRSTHDGSLAALELLLVARTLARLGYWDVSGDEPLFGPDDLALDFVVSERRELLSRVNRSLRETQL